jgi:hypothetical protein
LTSKTKRPLPFVATGLSGKGRFTVEQVGSGGQDRTADLGVMNL